MKKGQMLGAKLVTLLLLPAAALAQSAPSQDTQAELAALKEQVRLLQERIAQLERRQSEQEHNCMARSEKKVDAGFGRIKIGGLSQNWFAGGAASVDTFRLRRMEVKMEGQISPTVRWLVMVDPAKLLSVNSGTVGVSSVATGINRRTNILQDAFVSFALSPNLVVDVGQQKIPLSLEGLQSSARLETVERALFMTGPRAGGGIGYGDVRDIGITLKGSYPLADFQVALLNGVGEGQNDIASLDAKSFVGRLVFKPANGLSVGTSGAVGFFGNARLKRNRLGGELLFVRGRWTLKGEYMTGTDQASVGGPLFHRKGWYVHLGYLVSPQWEVIGRYDLWDPADGTNPRMNDLIIGVNHYLRGHNAKLQLNLVRRHLATGKERNLMLFNAQTAF